MLTLSALSESPDRTPGATLADARAKLADPVRRDGVLAVLGSAALCAACALALAGLVVLGPPGWIGPPAAAPSALGAP